MKSGLEWGKTALPPVIFLICSGLDSTLFSASPVNKLLCSIHALLLANLIGRKPKQRLLYVELVPTFGGWTLFLR